MSTPATRLTDADIDFIVDECSHFERGAIASGRLAIHWIQERQLQVNLERYDTGQPRLGFPDFLRLYINELAPQSRLRWQRLGWDPMTPHSLSEGDSFSDEADTLDTLTLGLIERALWHRQKDIHLGEVDALARASLQRHQQRFPDGEIIPGTVPLEKPAAQRAEFRAAADRKQRREVPEDAAGVTAGASTEPLPDSSSNQSGAANRLVSAYTGAAGRPTSAHLVRLEHARRISDGIQETTLSDEAQVLSEWLGKNHPRMPRMTQGTVANVIREAYWNARNTPTK